MKGIFFATLAGLCLLAPLAANAGGKLDRPVTITKPNTVIRYYATGSLGSVRNSADSLQTIGCGLQARAGQPVQITCLARDSLANQVTCSSTDPALIEVVRSISTTDQLGFGVGTGGVCVEISVYKGSENPPPQL